jgi:GNAT superfamily N-acetyltransferase
MSLEIQWTSQPEDLNFLQSKLLGHVEEHFGLPNRQNFTWVMRGDDGEIIAGIAGFSHWNWAYVGQIWVHKDWQRQGFGKQLLAQVAAWAKQNSLTGIYLDTFESKVKSFYEGQGFLTIGGIPDFPLGHQRYFLYRRLDDPGTFLALVEP